MNDCVNTASRQPFVIVVLRLNRAVVLSGKMSRYGCLHGRLVRSNREVNDEIEKAAQNPTPNTHIESRSSPHPSYQTGDEDWSNAFPQIVEGVEKCKRLSPGTRMGNILKCSLDNWTGNATTKAGNNRYSSQEKNRTR